MSWLVDDLEGYLVGDFCVDVGVVVSGMGFMEYLIEFVVCYMI